ncbi:MAG TPA: hypothetical protein VM422_07820, partial [Amaricoccus sp.]|nr:hypothetical protein [Amaricoccus sp.]
MADAPNDPSLKLWLRLWRDWLAPHWGMLAVSLAMTAIVAVASAGYSKLIQLVMTAFQGDTSGVVWWGPAGVIVLSAANGFGQYFRETTSANVTTRMETELRKTMFEQLVGTDLAKLQTEAPAGLAARFSSDISLLGTAVRSLLGGLTGTRAMAKTRAMPMVSCQSMPRRTPKVTTMVSPPVRPPRSERTAVPIRLMSEEKRAARPAGASVCRRARSVPTS